MKVTPRDVHLVVAYLRGQASLKNWPRLNECADIVAELGSHLKESYQGDFGALTFPVRQVRTPHGNGWFSFARGTVIDRRTALRVLLRGPQRAKIETWQSDNPNSWDDE